MDAGRRVRAPIMGQDSNKVAIQYDTVAKEYAEKFCGEHEQKPKDCEMFFKFSQEIGNRKPIWDFGCGPGQTTKYLSDLGIEISGMDLSEKLLERARTLHPKIHFQKGNILEPDFESESIAGVVAFYAIVHFSEGQVGRAFDEIFRVLQPGGVFFLAYHIGDETIHLDEFLGQEVELDFILFRNDFILRCLEDSGFRKIEVVERDPYPEVEYQSQRAYVFSRKPMI